MPQGFVHHYSINNQPDNCPWMVNHEIIYTIVSAYNKDFGSVQPSYDSWNIMYVRNLLPLKTIK